MIKISKDKEMMSQCDKAIYKNDNAVETGDCPSKSKHNLLIYYVWKFSFSSLGEGKTTVSLRRKYK